MKKSKKKQRSFITNLQWCISLLNLGIFYLYLNEINFLSPTEFLRIILIISSITISIISILIPFKTKDWNYLIFTLINLFVLSVIYINRNDVSHWIKTGSRDVITYDNKLERPKYSRYRSY